MITFLDERDVEHGALATIKVTNAVNGERSLTGEIESGDYVLTNIERGWRLRFDDEFYVVTYAKPIDDGKGTHVTFDAVHQFFWDFDKSSVHEQLNDGSHTFLTYLDFIFTGSDYTYTIDPLLKVYAFEKQSFGYKSRLKLFNDVITSSGVEFQVNGKVVRILEKTGTDLSTVVRKNFNMNELGIEKNIGDFVTYQKGFGAWIDENDHSKGRLVTDYTSPLASVYGKLEAEPLVDERYTQADNMVAALKANVDNSYSISITLDMEDLTRAGYDYTQPRAGDYIMAINETLDFQEKIRIVSFTSEYDVSGQLVKHEVTCNDIGVVKKLSASYNLTKEQAQNASDSVGKAVEMANKALVSADGKSTVYFGNEFPKDEPKGTLHKGDSLYLTVGDTTKMYYWTGADWEELPIVNDVEAFKEQIVDELKDVPNREEFENKIAEELANSKAEIETQIETAKTQAESNAKEYADTINQETAKVAEQANTAADEIKADLVNVKNNLTATSLVANNAQAAVDEAKQDLTEVASELNTAKQDLANSVTAVNTKVDSTKAELTQAKQDLTSHAQQLQTQANAQTELSKRVTTVETTANGTKTTVNELTKTVSQNGKDITSVTNRTKTVEDDLANTKTTLTQVQTTANSASQKTATLEAGLNGLSARLSSLKIGGRNLLTKTNQGKTNWSWTISSGGATAEDCDVNGVNAVKLTRTSDSSVTWSYISYSGLLRNLVEPNTQYTLSFDVKPSVDVSFTATLMQGDAQNRLTNSVGMGTALADVWTRISCVLTSVATLPESLVHQVVYLQGMPTGNGNWLAIKDIKLEKGNVATDYSPSEVDLEQKVAEYKQTADQNYASLSSTVQTLDGTVKQNKSEFDQTASQLRTSISTVEGKIPTSIGARNYIRNYGLTATGWTSNKAGWKFEIISDNTAKSGQYLKATCTTASTSGGGFYKNLFDFSDGRFFGKQMTWSMDIKLSKAKYVKIGPEWGYAYLDFNATTEWKRYSKTFTVATTTEYNHWIFYTNDNIWNVGDIVYIRDVQLEDGSIATSPVPAIEDTESDITKLNTTLTQTADGLRQLSTQVTSQGSTIISHTNSINSLATGLSAKVSQTDFNALSGRVTTAENNITAKANELSSKITSVEGKIPTTVGGRNYALGTGTAKSSTGGKLYDLSSAFDGIADDATLIIEFDWSVTAPTSTSKFRINRVITHSDGTPTQWNDTIVADGVYTDISSSSGSGHYSGTFTKVPYNGKTVSSRYLNLNQTTDSGTVTISNLSVRVGSLKSDWQPAPEDYDSALATAQSEIKQTTDSIKASVSSLDKSTVKSASLTINTDGIVMKAGKSTTDVANAIGSYFAVNQNAINLFSDKINVKGSMIVDGAITSNKIASKSINTAHLNGKIITADVIATGAITANAIKAGAVTTDKMTANSINGDRITAGTLDAAKIKAGSITASQIASGTITSAQIKTGTISAANIAAGAITTDKIAANSINSSKIVSSGITANVIKGGKLQSLSNATNFELDTGKLFYNNNNTGIFRVQANASTMGLKFSNTSITVSGTSRILSRVILGGDRRETSLDDGKWDQGGFTGIVAETINGVDSNAHSQADTLRVIGDNIYFTHSYNYDAQTKTSAQGWKMETFSPFSSYAGNVVLKPYGINYRQSDIITGDVRLDNGDGSGYWVRGCIRTLRNCFQHYLNGGTTSGAMNAIRDALKEISGV